MPILLIIFLIMFCLKMAGIGLAATLSWWIITLPLWVIPAIFVGTFVVVGGVGVVLWALSLFIDTLQDSLRHLRMMRQKNKRK